VIFGNSIGVKVGGRKAAFWLALALALSVVTAAPSLADDCVADRGGLIDGFIDPVPPAQINIDGNCTIRNFPASNPLTSNISFFTRPGRNNQRWLIIFDNVVHTGQMSCNAVQGHKIWFTNGSSSSIKSNCQNLLIPVEKIDKQNPPNTTTATIGVPFTWKLVIPVLFDPATGNVINTSGSVNDLHSISITDDLTPAALGVDLTYVSHTAYWLNNGNPVAHSFSNNGGVLTFGNFPVVPAGRQFVIELTVVLNNTINNSNGKTFFNTAKWEFGRLIDNVFYQPLPGEWGISPPLTIASPDLVVTKSGPATMNLGQWGDFTIDVHNIGLSDAWDVSIQDLLPDGPTGGMCDVTPVIQSAQVFDAGGNPVPGKGPLVPGADFSLTYSGAPNCQLDLRMLTPAAAIGGDERLIIRYQTQLDSNTQNGVSLTNYAGAIRWFNGDSTNPNRITFTHPITNGTPGTPDPEDLHTVTTAITGYFFDKTVEDRNTGANPATTAAPGDVLRYTLRFRATSQALSNFRIYDEMDDLNPGASFDPNTLTLVSFPAGADITNTSGTGGANGTGVIDVRNLSLAAGEEAVVVFDITLASSLSNGSVVTNQATVRLASGAIFALSDDPFVNGTADPAIAGDEDPTVVTILSAPSFLVQKISTDLTADPNVLLAGETLRYTITVQNTGNGNATGVELRDAIPVNTTYVPGSTTLNGSPVADIAGMTPLVNGMLINSPADPTPGSMPVSAPGPSNVATITFDVVVDPAVVNGTVISNQGFVTAVDFGIINKPSDDPRTPIPDDPTRNIVGNLPLLYAEKAAALLIDLGTPGVVDPGDTLRYTITVQNSAAIPATGVVLQDNVPANTTYVLNSTTLNGLAVADVSGQPPLPLGIDISSSDLTPPLPGPGAGTISPGQSAVLQFDLVVDPNTPGGTLIVNQATVASNELPDLPTDGDGNPATGPEPTIVVVGNPQQLAISKQVTVVGGGAALPGSTLEYVVTVTNIASVPAFDVVLTDDLNAASPGTLSYVAGSATMNGSSAGVSFFGSTITGAYSAVYGQLDPGGIVTLRFRAVLDPNLAQGTVVTNTGVVEWNTPTETASASVSLVVGGIPGFSVLSGSAWHDADFDGVRDTGERVLAGWAVELYRDGLIYFQGQTDANGDYRIIGVEPNDVTGRQYEIRFLAPGAGASTAKLGVASSPFTNRLQLIRDIIVTTGANLQGLNLPITPNGVVYNSISRGPIAGATLTMLNAGTGQPLPTGCLDDAAQQGQITLADGYYKFSLNFSDAIACPDGGDYVVEVIAPPGGNYVAGYSQIIPPATTGATAAFSVPGCTGTPDDVIPATGQYCEVQRSEFAPSASVPARSAGTVHYAHLMLDSSRSAGSSQIYNNHIPLDPLLSGSLSITKTTPLLNVNRGQLVPYVITVNNTSGMLLTDTSIVDRMPAGFVYVEGSAILDGVATEPTITGLELSWDGPVVAGTQSRTLKLLLAAGAGVTEGEYVNRAQVVNSTTRSPMSGVATATVRIVPDPTFECSDVIGKVFNDANRNGRQDDGEEGLPGVRVVTPRGLQATTDRYGRYHITCAVVPNESRGSNFVVKLDDRSLPSGFRMSTNQVQIKRATRGKALKADFGASVYRVVSIDLSDAAFEQDSTVIRVQWRARIDRLLEELRKAPSVLRLSYVADIEDAGLVDRRVEAIKKQVTDAWDEASYPLTVEPEIFWRRGAPPKRREIPAPEGR